MGGRGANYKHNKVAFTDSIILKDLERTPVQTFPSPRIEVVLEQILITLRFKVFYMAS